MIVALLRAPADDFVTNFAKEFPPRQRPASFSIDQVMEKVNASMRTRQAYAASASFTGSVRIMWSNAASAAFEPSPMAMTICL